MRNIRRWTVMIALAATAACVPAAWSDPLPSTSPDMVLPDPVPDKDLSFPPGIATAGTADPGMALDRVTAGGRKGCSPVNPCAVAPPALESVVTPTAEKAAPRRRHITDAGRPRR